MSKTDITKLIKGKGGKVATAKQKISENVTYILTSDEGVKENPDEVKQALKLKVPLVREDFVHDSIKAGKKEDVTFYRISAKPTKTPSQDGKEEEEEEEDSQKGSTESSRKRETLKSRYEEKEGKMKVVKKGRSVVDPYFKNGEDYHVLEEGKDVIYNVMLNFTDISVGQRGRNSFYALQLLQHDTKPLYVVFRRWGRVGAPGNVTFKEFSGIDAAKGLFEEVYEEKTGNKWSKRHKFEKQPGKFYPVEIDYGDNDDADVKLMDVSQATGSKLDPRVQNIISLMFDIEMMKDVLLELEIDVKKMPLGKLTKSQIKNGYQCLTDIQNLLNLKPNGNKDDDEPVLTDDVKRQLLELTNKFYTLIPQDFGDKKPPVIKSEELLKDKLKLVEALQDLEIAASLLKADPNSDNNNAIDASYKKLNTQIVPLDKSSDLYKRLESYAITSHDSKYFSSFKIIVEDIFEVDRDGEDKRFESWAAAENRMLLWHGSRLTNWVGILSQGLRIAPPEAPKTGYRFGKGVYFADVISKSASYCFASPQRPVGFMILNEVALGNIYKVTRDTYMEKAPNGHHSTMALGHTAPDPKANYVTDTGVTIPLGNPVKTGVSSSCTHNEFIVYDTTQIRTRYLLKIRFYDK